MVDKDVNNNSEMRIILEGGCLYIALKKKGG
jgi:hypothetical protein